MTRRDKAGGKAAKAQRRKTLRRRSAPEARTPSLPSLPRKETNVARLMRERDEALQQQTATGEVLKLSFAGHRQMPNQYLMPSSRVLGTGCCGAMFGAVYLYDGDRIRIAAIKTLQLVQRSNFTSSSS